MASHKVLILDGNNSDRTRLRQLLPPGNYEIAEAGNGQEALALIHQERERIRFILLDAGLPQISGWDVVRHLSTDPELNRIPLVLMLNPGDRAAEAQALGYPSLEPLTKPFNRKQLKQVVKSAIAKAKAALSRAEVAAANPPPPASEPPQAARSLQDDLWAGFAAQPPVPEDFPEEFQTTADLPTPPAEAWEEIELATADPLAAYSTSEEDQTLPRSPEPLAVDAADDTLTADLQAAARISKAQAADAAVGNWVAAPPVGQFSEEMGLSPWESWIDPEPEIPVLEAPTIEGGGLEALDFESADPSAAVGASLAEPHRAEALDPSFTTLPGLDSLETPPPPPPPSLDPVEMDRLAAPEPQAAGPTAEFSLEQEFLATPADDREADATQVSDFEFDAEFMSDARSGAESTPDPWVTAAPQSESTAEDPFGDLGLEIDASAAAATDVFAEDFAHLPAYDPSETWPALEETDESLAAHPHDLAPAEWSPSTSEAFAPFAPAAAELSPSDANQSESALGEAESQVVEPVGQIEFSPSDRVEPPLPEVDWFADEDGAEATASDTDDLADFMATNPELATAATALQAEDDIFGLTGHEAGGEDIPELRLETEESEEQEIPELRLETEESEEQEIPELRLDEEDRADPFADLGAIAAPAAAAALWPDAEPTPELTEIPDDPFADFAAEGFIPDDAEAQNELAELPQIEPEAELFADFDADSFLPDLEENTILADTQQAEPEAESLADFDADSFLPDLEENTILADTHRAAPEVETIEASEQTILADQHSPDDEDTEDPAKTTATDALEKQLDAALAAEAGEYTVLEDKREDGDFAGFKFEDPTRKSQPTLLQEGMVTLRGFDEVKMRFESAITDERIMALNDAIAYDQAGYALIFQALREADGPVRQAAEELVTNRIRQSENAKPLTQQEWLRMNCIHVITGHDYWVQTVAIADDNRTLVSGSKDSTIKTWNLLTGQELRTIRGHESSVLSIALSPESDKIISSSTDNTIKIWDLKTGNQLQVIKGDKHHKIYVVALSPDGKMLISASADQRVKPKFEADLEGLLSYLPSKQFSSLFSIVSFFRRSREIKIWDVQSGKSRGSLLGYSKGVTDLAIHPKGETVVSGSRDHTVKIWDLKTKRALNTLWGHTDEIRAVAISPDGKTIISGSRDKTIKIWDLRTGHVLRTLRGHSQSVTAIAISPDGKTLISGSRDATIKIWDLETGEYLNTLMGHTDLIRSVCVSPDGKHLASGSRDNTIRIWRSV